MFAEQKRFCLSGNAISKTLSEKDVNDGDVDVINRGGGVSDVVTTAVCSCTETVQITELYKKSK